MGAINEIQENTRKAIAAVMLSDDELIARFRSLKSNIPADKFARVVAALEGRDESAAAELRDSWTDFGFARTVDIFRDHKEEMLAE